jgi:hypothetical protein
MTRTEPPPIPTWMLQHLTPGPRSQALAGDLLEEFRSGRSDGWYWRQALAACAISWLNNLRTRVPLLVFALLWSMLAPAWKVFIDGIQGAPIFDRIWPLFGPVWVLPAFAVWLLLNSVFLCAGIFVFALSNSSFGQVLRGKRLIHAFLLALLVFVPIYLITFVLVNLYWFSFFANAKLAATSLGQIADLRILADAMRIPYLAALLCALWNTIPRSIHASELPAIESSRFESSTRPESMAPGSTLDPYTVKRFFSFMVGAGLVNAMIAGFLLCRLPDSHPPAFASLLIRAIIYVSIGALAGVVGAWAYWKSPSSPFREHPPIPFSLFALVCASGWVWVPAMMIFSEQMSAATALAAALGAILLATGLRNATFFVVAPAELHSSSIEPKESELFTESLYRAPPEAHGYAIAISLYAAVCALLNRWNLTAAALLALGAFLFAWKRTFAQSGDLYTNHESKRAARRLALVAIPAILVTIWALLDGVAHRNRVSEMNAELAASDGNSAIEHAHKKTQPQASVSSISGYESIILWPIPQKKQILPPLLARATLLAPGTTKPLVIRFDGAYWYFQPPEQRPSATAHQAHGTPLAIDIQSHNFIPLTMEAHQNLGTPIRLARCREIRVTLENRDLRPGVINLAVLLTDSISTGKPTLYVGQQPVLTGQPGQSIDSAPVTQALRFPIPAPAKIRKFDEITVMFLADGEHFDKGPKIAIQQFQLLPR